MVLVLRLSVMVVLVFRLPMVVVLVVRLAVVVVFVLRLAVVMVDVDRLSAVVVDVRHLPVVFVDVLDRAPVNRVQPESYYSAKSNGFAFLIEQFEGGHPVCRSLQCTIVKAIVDPLICRQLNRDRMEYTLFILLEWE
ncbi:hypothetical protein M8J77_014061 [Diaphorina citri]|nr:hypothetical protein M8J77_014061 [Diaphorina citri]